MPSPPLRPKRSLVSLSVSLLAVGAAGAQPAPQPPQPTTASGQLDTVTVTADRRVESIKDVPSSVSALQGEALDVLASGGQDVRALSGRVPSLNIESSFGRAFPRFYIRGYGNTDFRLNASQPVSLVLDDVVQENPILKGFPIFDVEQIEVLRGPQGTLFGRNSPAGVVKFDSVRPSDRLEGYGSLSWGTFGTANLEGAANVPLGEGWAARISLLHQRRDDWVDNTVVGAPTRELEGYRDSAVRAQLQYTLGRDFSALANVHARALDGSARLFRANIIRPGSNDLVAGFDEKKISIDGRNESTLDTLGGSLRLRWAFGDLALYAITGYESLDTLNRGDIDGGFGASFAPPSGPGFIPFPSETADGVPDHRQITQELRLESQYAGPFNWQLGLYWFDEDYAFESFGYDSLSGGAQTSYQRSRQKNKATAVFGSVNYAVTPAFKVRGGLRYTRDDKDFATEVAQGVTLSGPLTAEPSDSKLSWDLSGSFALDANTNLYARAANGYRATSIQPASAFNQQSTAKPETNTSLEAGIKADLFNRRARVAFGVFRYEVRDQQLTAVGGSNNGNVLVSAKKVIGQGFEFDSQAILADGLLFTAGVGYNKTEIRDKNLIVAACGSGCTVTDPVVVAANPAGGIFAPIVAIDGNPLPQAPKVTANFTLKYSVPVANGELYAFSDWAWRSKVGFFLYESIEFTGKSLTEGGLRLGYTWGNGNYDAAVYGRNITNQIRVTGGIDFNNLTGFVNEPRLVGVQFRAAF